MADRYDYRNAVLEDVKQYIEDECDPEEMKELGRDRFEQELYDTLWCHDSVTGNGSGSYTFNTWQAEENLAHNWSLMVEAAEEFGMEEPVIDDGWRYGPEYWDVTIRCYLLAEAIARALDDCEAEGLFDEEAQKTIETCENVLYNRV